MKDPQINTIRRILLPGALLLGATGPLVASCDPDEGEQELEQQLCKFTKSLEILHGELVREPGNPWQDVTVTIPIAGPYEFKLENGGMAGFAVYTSEGEPLVSPDEFNAHDSVHSWKGHLEAGTFELRVRLAGKPGTVVRYSLAGTIAAADGPTVVDSFTLTNGEPRVVSVCGGLSLLSFSADALHDADASVSFVAKCTARECLDPAPTSDHIEITTVDLQGYVFKDAPILDHPRVPFTVRTLDGQPIAAHEGAAQVINGEPLVRARSFIPHFSHIEDIGDVCGTGGPIPAFPFPFVGVEQTTQGNNDLENTHNGALAYDVDFGLSQFEVALAVADGQLYWRSGGGYYGDNHLLIRLHPDQNLFYRYGHCEEVSPEMLAKGLKSGGDPVAVRAGEPVCLVGNEGNVLSKTCTAEKQADNLCGFHLHGTVVEIADFATNPAGGVSKPHGYQGYYHGLDQNSAGEFKTFCPAVDGNPNACPTDYISLWNGCLTPGPDSPNWAWVEGRDEPALEPEIDPPQPEPEPDPDIELTCLMGLEAEQFIICPQLPELTFTDPEITPDQWYYDDLQRLVCAGAIDNGGEFRPNDKANRAEFLKVMLEVSYLDEDFVGAADEPFEDVKPQDWFYKYVAFAHEKKIVEGYAGDPVEHPGEEPGKQYFRPGDTIDRAEVAKVLVELGKAEGATSRFGNIHAYYGCLKGADQALSPEFPDVPWGEWYYFPVHALRFFDGGDNGTTPDGIVCGQEKTGTYQPGEDLNRAEMAKLACMSSGRCPSQDCAP